MRDIDIKFDAIENSLDFTIQRNIKKKKRRRKLRRGSLILKTNERSILLETG